MFALDGFVILAYFALIISIGLYKGRGEKTMEGYAVGDRNIPWWAVLASILAAEVSAGTFLGVPGEGYGLRNFTYGQLAIGTVLARIIVAYVFIRKFYDLQVVSIYEFLETRFGRPTKLASSAVFLVTRALASGSRMYVPAILLVVAWQLYQGEHLRPEETIGFYAGAIAVLVAVTAVYTTFGGIKAVVWTDLLQVFLMFGAMGYALFTLWHAVGGWQPVVEATHQVVLDPKLVALQGEAAARAQAEAVAQHALTFWDSGLREGLGFWGNVKNVLETEYTVWSAVLASVFVTMATHGTDQDMVQRMLTAPDVRQSRRSLILSGLADIPVALCFTFIGVLLWVFYHQPQHQAEQPADGQVFVHFILEHLPSGLRGVMAAGLFATAMGSLSTALNALATSFTRDFYLGVWHPEASSHRQMKAARLSTVFFAVLLALIGLGTAYVAVVMGKRIIPIVLGSFGYTYGSLLGIFLVGMLTRTRGSNAGNALAMICGFVAVAILSGLPNEAAHIFGRVLYAQPAWLPVVEFPWRILFGAVVTLSVALCFRTPAEAQEVARSRALA